MNGYRDQLNVMYSIDPTHVGAIPYKDAVSWIYDPKAEEYNYGIGCTLVSTGAKNPRAEFTQIKQWAKSGERRHA